MPSLTHWLLLLLLLLTKLCPSAYTRLLNLMVPFQSRPSGEPPSLPPLSHVSPFARSPSSPSSSSSALSALCSLSRLLAPWPGLCLCLVHGLPRLAGVSLAPDWRGASMPCFASMSYVSLLPAKAGAAKSLGLPACLPKP